MNHRSSAKRGAVRKLALMAAAAALNGGGWSLAHAQTAPALATAEAGQPSTTAEIVVTGTRIRGVAPVGSSLLSVGRDEITRAPVASTTDILRQLPIVTGLGADEATTNGGAAVQGASFNNTYARAANLRGLGTTATLVLVDGHRVAPQGQTAQINDLDLIPALAVERIEVVADGASAIYGSDAVAGVINVIMRKRYNGATATVRYGGANDYNTFLVGGIVGKTWSTGSIMATVEHSARSRLAASDRPKLYNDDFSPYGGSGLQQLAAPGNVLIGGVAYPIPAGQNGQGFTLGQLGSRTTPNTLSRWAQVDAIPKQERNTFLFTATQDVGSHVTLFGEGIFTRRDFERRNIAAASSAAGLNVPSSNPYSPCFAGRSQVNSQGLACPANGTIPVQYSFINDLGPVQAHGKQVTWSLRTGADFKLPATWRGTVALGYSRSQDVSVVDGNLQTVAANAALAGSANVVVNGVNQTVTLPAGIPRLNLFCGGVSCNDPATLAYISGVTFRPAQYDYKYVTASTDGPLFSLPGGMVRLAAGMDLRHDILENLNRVNTNTPSNAIFVDNLTKTKRNVDSFYGELFVPIVGEGNAMAGIKTLSLSLAGRTEKYSDFGRTTNPKIGLTWEPANGLNFHGSYGTSFRAPTLADIDPRTAAVFSGPALTAAQAVALGLPNVSTLSYVTTTGGTIGIQPETAKTWSLGADYRPEWLKGLTVSVNYYRLTYRNRIDQPIQNAGTLAALNASPLYDSLILYNPSFFPGKTAGLTQAAFNAELNRIFTSTTPVFNGIPPAAANVVAITRGNKVNAGTLQTSGLDLTAFYSFSNKLGDWRVGGTGQYVIEYVNQIVTAQAPVDLVNQFSAVGSPLRFRGRAEVGWRSGGWGATIYANYANKYHIPRSQIPATAPAQYLDIKAYTTFDASLSYRFDDGADFKYARGVTLQLNVQNAFNKAPPLMINNGTVPLLFDSSNASPIGRVVSAQLTKAF